MLMSMSRQFDCWSHSQDANYKVAWSDSNISKKNSAFFLHQRLGFGLSTSASDYREFKSKDSVKVKSKLFAVFGSEILRRRTPTLETEIFTRVHITHIGYVENFGAILPTETDPDDISQNMEFLAIFGILICKNCCRETQPGEQATPFNARDNLWAS